MNLNFNNPRNSSAVKLGATRYIIAFIFCFSTFSSFSQVNRPKPGNQWNGVIRKIYKSKNTAQAGTLETTYTFEAVVKDGMSTNKYSEKEFNRGDCWSVESYAEGTDEIPFEPDFFDDRFSYDVIMPIIKGRKTEKAWGSCPVHGEKSEEVISNDVGFSVDVPLGDNRDILIGDTVWTETTNVAGALLTIEVSISWNLTRAAEINLIVTPVNYATWLPIPGKSEIESGNNLSIHLQLFGKNGSVPNAKASAFELELKQTSKEPGTALNAPLTGNSSPPGFDLAFDAKDGSVSKEGQFISIETKDGLTANAFIACYDGGASATLIVTAIMEDGRRIRGELLKKGGEKEILLPKRKAGSLIAEAWAQNNGNPRDDDDEEVITGNTNPGDGLTAYEEYRGVFSKGKHIRLNPQKKELLVQVMEKETGLYTNGFNQLKQASGIVVLELTPGELSSDRLVNRNSAHRKYFQHGLVIRSGQNPGSAMGRNYPLEKTNATPKSSDSVIIDIRKMQGFFRDQQAALKKASRQMPFTLQDYIGNTVAHELAHGIGLDHHGPPFMIEERTIVSDNAKSVRIVGTNNLDITDRPYTMYGIGIPGNEESGDLSCIMTYTNYYHWVLREENEVSVYYAVPMLPLGKKFCTSNVGTGINAHGYFGNAKHGNCLSKIKVRDD